MSIIEITTIDSPKETIVYDLMCNQTYARMTSTRQADFYDFLVKRPLLIDYAIIGLNKPYRNTLYALYPHIKICINPKDIQEIFDGVCHEVLGIDYCFYEEVAATGEAAPQDIFISTQLFIRDFYNQTNKQDALRLYENWASEVPLGIPKLYRLVRVMEFYQEEILMYFELKTIGYEFLKPR